MRTFLASSLIAVLFVVLAASALIYAGVYDSRLNDTSLARYNLASRDCAHPLYQGASGRHRCAAPAQ